MKFCQKRRIEKNFKIENGAIFTIMSPNTRSSCYILKNHQKLMLHPEESRRNMYVVHTIWWYILAIFGLNCLEKTLSGKHCVVHVVFWVRKHFGNMRNLCLPFSGSGNSNLLFCSQHVFVFETKDWSTFGQHVMDPKNMQRDHKQSSHSSWPSEVTGGRNQYCWRAHLSDMFVRGNILYPQGGKSDLNMTKNKVVLQTCTQQSLSVLCNLCTTSKVSLCNLHTTNKVSLCNSCTTKSLWVTHAWQAKFLCATSAWQAKSYKKAIAGMQCWCQHPYSVWE